MELTHTFVFQDKKYTITVNYNRAMQILQSVPPEIAIKLMKNIDYQVESQVSPEVFQGFLNYWEKSNEPKINSENMFEYYLISDEFKIKLNGISGESNEDNLHISSIIYITKQNEAHRPTTLKKEEHERYISLHLDRFLQNKEAQMLQLPTNSLYNIFFHKERVLNDHQAAFDFVERNKISKPDLSILLPSLNSDKLRRKTVIELFTKNENYNFKPQTSPTFFSSYEEQINHLRTENQELKQLLGKVIGISLNELGDKNEKFVKEIFYDELFDVNTKIIYSDDKQRVETTALCFAIESKDVDLVNHLLAKPEIDVNAIQSIYEKRDEKEVSYTLFPNEVEKVTFEVSCYKEQTPLCLAVESGNIEIVEALLNNQKLDVNAKSIFEEVATITSVEFSAPLLKLAKTLISSPEEIFNSKENLKKASKPVIKRRELSAIHLAIKNKNIEMIKLLLNHKNIDVNNKLIENHEQIKLKIESINLFDSSGRTSKTPLHLAIETKNIEIVKLLLSCPELDVNIALHGESTIINSASLLAFGFLCALEGTPLFDRLSELKIPLDKSAANAFERTETPVLCVAVEEGDAEIVEHLFTRPELKINDKCITESYFQCTLTESEQKELQEKVPEIAICIEKGNKNVPTKKEEETALHIAVRNENIEIINILVNNKIDTEATNEEQNKAIYLTDNEEIKTLLTKTNH